MARPLIQIDERVVRNAAEIGCTDEEIARLVGCGESTVKRRFGPLLKQGRAKLISSIKRKQVQMALNGNVAMLIWLGKQYCGQSERIQQKAEVKVKHGVMRVHPPPTEAAWVRAASGALLKSEEEMSSDPDTKATSTINRT